MKICPNCNTEWGNQYNFCGSCGGKLENKSTFCGNCGSKIEAGQKFCGYCGAEVSENITDKILESTSRMQDGIKESASQIHDTIRNQIRTTFSEENINHISEKAREARRMAINSIPSADEAVSGIWGSLSNILVSINSFLSRFFTRYHPENVPTSDEDKYNLLYSDCCKLEKINIGIAVLLIMLGAITYITKSEIFEIVSLIIFFGVSLYCFIMFLIFLLYNIKNIKRIVIAAFCKITAFIFVSVIILIMSAIIPFLPLILIGITIYKNKKRREFLNQHKRYKHLFIWGVSISLFFSILSGGFQKYSDFADIKAERLESQFEQYDTVYTSKNVKKFENEISKLNAQSFACMYFSFSFTPIFYALWSRKVRKFFKKEQECGIKYDNVVKLMYLVPVTWLFLMISILSWMIHIDGLNPEDILADSAPIPDPSMGIPDGATSIAHASGIDVSNSPNTDPSSMVSENSNALFNQDSTNTSIDVTEEHPVTDTGNNTSADVISPINMNSNFDTIQNGGNESRDIASHPHSITIENTHGQTVASADINDNLGTIHDESGSYVGDISRDSAGTTTIMTRDGHTMSQTGNIITDTDHHITSIHMQNIDGSDSLVDPRTGQSTDIDKNGKITQNGTELGQVKEQNT